MGLLCKRCGSEEHVKNGLMRTKQRYLCKGCGLNFTDTPPRGKPLALKAAAVLLYVSGLSMNRTAKLLGVSTPTVQAWLEQFAAAYAQKPEPEGRAVVIELDEIWHYLKKKSEPLWIWKAWDRATGQLVDWECGGRDKATCERLIARLTRWRTRLYCADDYAVYGVLLPVGQLYTGKDETHGIERDNARPRHGLARFRRRSIVVSKAKRMVDVSIALFARFAGNHRIGDLISMLA
jgi:IS1 family transposase/transposase-like protein